MHAGSPTAGPISTTIASPPRNATGMLGRWTCTLWKLVSHPICWLSLLTALTAWMRFYRLDQPTLWGDEVRTIWRTCGTFQDLLDRLRDEAFTPLHYLLTWSIAQKWTLSPFVVRVVPAICATLMVPAMYFLSRQLFSRQASFIVALFTCCSAWINNYGRDAKMYAQAWVFGVLCMASFLWWLRKGYFTAWLCWVAAGCVMVGFHVTGAMLLLMCPLILLTSRHLHWARSLLLVLGLGIIATGPIIYYTQFGYWGEKGIHWVRQRNAGASGTTMLADTSAAFLFRYNYLSERPMGVPLDQPDPEFRQWANASLTICCVIVALGVLPWKNRTIDDRPERWWRITLWLGTWMVVLTYGAYCRSVFPRTTPQDWMQMAGDQLSQWTGGRWWTFGVLWTLALLFLHRARRAGRWIIPLLLSQHLLFLFAAMLLAGPTQIPFVIDQWLGYLTGPWFLYPLLVLAPVMTFYFCSPHWRGRLARVVGLVIVCGILYGACHLLAGNVTVSEQNDSVMLPRYLGFIWPAVALTLGAALCRIPNSLARWVLVVMVLGLNLAQSYARLYYTEPPLDRIASDTLAYNTDAKSGTLVMCSDYNAPGAQPGMSNMTGGVGCYYLVITSHSPFDPGDLFNRNYLYGEMGYRSFTTPLEVAREVRRRGSNRVIIWRRINRVPKASDDPFVAALGKDWTLRDLQRQPRWVHWTWTAVGIFERRVYERIQPPAISATTPVKAASATRPGSTK